MENTNQAFTNRLNEFACNVNATWTTLAWLCKQAAGFAVYQRNLEYVRKLWDIAKRTRYATACRKLLSGLLYGITRKERTQTLLFDETIRADYFLLGKFNINAKTQDTEFLAKITDTYGFRHACEVLGFYRKQCGINAAQAAKYLRYQPKD